jgi:hypothetical protein
MRRSRRAHRLSVFLPWIRVDGLAEVADAFVPAIGFPLVPPFELLGHRRRRGIAAVASSSPAAFFSAGG